MKNLSRRRLVPYPPRFFELTDEETTLFKECWANTRGNFELEAFHTDSFRAKGNESLGGFIAPTRWPGQAIGWSGLLFPKKLFLPLDEIGNSKLEIEAAPVRSYQFIVVVRPEDASRALTAILRHAVKTLRLAEVNASSAGLMI